MDQKKCVVKLVPELQVYKEKHIKQNLVLKKSQLLPFYTLE